MEEWKKTEGTEEPERHLCPVCRFYFFEKAGDYEICPVCNWENDPVQEKDPDFEGGANEWSLNQAREFFMREMLEEEE